VISLPPPCKLRRHDRGPFEIRRFRAVRQDCGMVYVRVWEARFEVRDARSENRNARSNLREARSNNRNARSELREARSNNRNARSKLRETRSNNRNARSNLRETRSKTRNTRSELWEVRSKRKGECGRQGIRFRGTKKEDGKGCGLTAGV
jgi:hypothetical protein